MKTPSWSTILPVRPKNPTILPTELWKWVKFGSSPPPYGPWTFLRLVWNVIAVSARIATPCTWKCVTPWYPSICVKNSYGWRENCKTKSWSKCINKCKFESTHVKWQIHISNQNSNSCKEKTKIRGTPSLSCHLLLSYLHQILLYLYSHCIPVQPWESK